MTTTGSGGATATDSRGLGGSSRGGSSADTVACSMPVLNPGDTTETVQVGGSTRSYFLHVPAAYDGTKPVALVVDFHFLGNTGSQELRVSPYPAVTDPDGVIVAFPDGLAGPSGTGWNIGPCCVAKDIDDVAFTRALIKQLQSKACIDAGRIYAVGYALGGGMVYFLACNAADIFAAVAPVGFDLVQENLGDCRPVRPISVISSRELSDVMVPYQGGAWTMVQTMPVTLLGAESTFLKWAELDGCTGSPTAQDSNGCSSFRDCRGGVEVVLCTKQAGVPVADNGSIIWPILRRQTMP